LINCDLENSFLLVYLSGALIIMIWYMENWRRGAKFPFALGPNNSLGGPALLPIILLHKE
jgi:hypothetical protein